MNSTNDRLAVLRRMRTEGRISDEEYDDLSRAYTDPSNQGRLVEHPGVTPDQPDPKTAPVEEPAPSFRLTLRKDLSATYLAGLGIAAGALIVAAAIGGLPWFVSISAVLLLASTLYKGLRLVTRIGGVVVAAIVVVGVLSSLDGDDELVVQPVAATPSPTTDPYPPVPGSLDIYMDQVTELWNSVDSPPRIVRGLTRHNEIGEYDTFLYRFGEWGRVAGAFDPDNEVLHALLAAGQFSGEATSQLYLHLCFMVAPYSQECIDSYHQDGLGGGTLDDFLDVSHEAEWSLGPHVWRLEIDQNVVTIRVYGEDAL